MHGADERIEANGAGGIGGPKVGLNRVEWEELSESEGLVGEKL
jgi:hypothetical protein